MEQFTVTMRLTRWILLLSSDSERNSFIGVALNPRKKKTAPKIESGLM